MHILLCPFARAILSNGFGCENATRLFIGEGADIGCTSDTARTNCLFLLETLKQNAQFALKLRSPDARLPHGKLMKLQCGGLLGLQAALSPERARQPTLANIHALVVKAHETYGSLRDLPYRDIVKSVSAYKPRRRGGAR